MKTIELELSAPDVDFIHSLQKEEKVFALEAIEEKIAREKRNSLEDLLKEGYQATAKEDLSIANDFAIADFENL